MCAVGVCFDADSLSLEAFRSVAGGVKIFNTGRAAVPTASRLCSLEKDGYGRLDFESDLRGTSSTFPGIEDRLLLSTGERDVLDDVFSFVATFRWDRCLSLSLSRSLSLSFLSLSFSDFVDSFFSRRLSALLSRTLEGMLDRRLHDATCCGSGQGAYIAGIICVRGFDVERLRLSYGA